MNKTVFAVVSGVLVLAASGSAVSAAGERAKDGGGWGFWGGGGHAGGKGHAGGMSLQRLDTNKDGSISREEFLAPRKEAFQALDADKNGSVAATEYRAPFDEKADFRTKRFMKRLDTNGDGKVSKDEFAAGPKQRFADNDLNSDGTLSNDERPGHRRGGSGWGWGAWGEGKRHGEGKGRDEGKGHTLQSMLERVDEKFKELDTNGDGFIDAAERTASVAARNDLTVKRVMHRQDGNKDGQVSEAEFIAKAEQRFSVLDLNSDGKIAAEDLSPGQRRRWGGEK